ncbi:TPA: fimbrial protein [Serratia fonticola]
MKLNKIMMATVVAFGISSAANAANQGSGTVKFEGSIIDAPCSISADTMNQTVSLGQISKVALANGGQSTPVSFDITLENCDISTKQSVQTTFNGAASANNADLLGIAGTAQGAGVAISQGGMPVKLNTPTSAQNLNDGTNTLQFAAYLKGETATAVITPGDFYAVANFALAYP